MGLVLAVTRWAIPLVLALAACGNGGGQSEQSRILKAAFSQLVPDRPKEDAAGPAPPRLTRAAIEATGTAMIRARLVYEEGAAVYSGAAENGGYVSYVSRFAQMITMRGTRITASRGMGYDLLAAEVDAADPLVVPVPLADWPERISPSYRFPGAGPGGTAFPVTCRFTVGAAREIEIVEITYSGVEIEEACTGGGTSFSNYHFVEPETGAVWRTIQWLGPDQGSIDIEVLQPFDAD